MNYTILDAHCIYENGKLTEVAVLWADGDFVRATYSTLNIRFGYFNLPKNTKISEGLFQEVAGAGSYLDEERKNKYFPGTRKWSK